MNTVTAEVKERILVLPADTIEKLGWQEDTRILFKKQNGKIIIRPKELSSEEIADVACTYLVKYVGDATDVKTPVWQDGKWRVEVVLSYRPQTVGFLTFSTEGKLIENESDSPAKMKGIAK